METTLYNKDGSKAGTVTLNEAVFGVTPNPALVHQYVVNYLANQRQGTGSSKGRSEVSGGGRKPWRQKGTGRARSGTIRSPLWKGGGVVFGPQPHSFYRKFPKGMKRGATLSAFSDKAQNDRLVIVEDLKLDKIKTRDLVNILNKLGLIKKKCLILDEGVNHELWLSLRNIEDVKYSRAPLANAFDIVNAEVLLVTKAGLDKIEEVYTS